MIRRAACFVAFTWSVGIGCSDDPSPMKRPECTRNGVCDDGIYCNGEERCHDGRCVPGPPVDCDDGVACTKDSCDESRWACRHEAPDADSDGHPDSACHDAHGKSLGDDCSDADASRHPGAQELCDPDDVDEDCVLSTVGDTDADGDGYTSAACCNATARERQCGPDCNDANASVNPGAAEVCDGLDDDCDGQVDEGVESILYRDEDGDGYGAGSATLKSCVPVDGYARQAGDCDDTDASIHPGAPERCSDPPVDRDCNGVPDDLPGGCGCKTGDERACPLPGACSSGTLSCVNEVWSEQCSTEPVPEVCNGLDDDCDGQIDDGVTTICYEDEDGDGYPAAGAVGKSRCADASESCPAGFTSRAPAADDVDCDRKDATVNPGARESCNGKDDNCDGHIDEGLPEVRRYIDADGDGVPGTAVNRCATDPGSSDQSGDCMDDNPLGNPMQAGVFTNPACGRGMVPCPAGSAWKCKPADAADCDASLGDASWDYDCDGRTTGESAVGGPCLSGGTCSAGCGPSGFVFPSSGSPACGSTADYQRCRCLGAQGGGCTGDVEQHAYPCH